MEVLGDGAIGREKALGVTRGFKPLHTLFPLAGRLVRVFCAAVEIPVLPMFHPWKNLALGGSITPRSHRRSSTSRKLTVVFVCVKKGN